MRRLFPAVALLALGLACTQMSPGWTSYTVPCSSGVCTGVGLAGVDAGMLLAGVDNFRLGACAPSGQTFLDGGSMLDYFGDSKSLQVFRGQPLDQGPPAAGQSCAVWPDFKVGVVSGLNDQDYVYFAPSGVTVTGSSSGNMTVYLWPNLKR